MIKDRIKKVVGDRGTKVLKEIKYGIYNFLCGLFPMRDEIIFESHPELTCNSYEVFRYLTTRGVNKKLKFVWIVENPNNHRSSQLDGVEYISRYVKGVIPQIRRYIRLNRAKIIIACNCHISKQMTSSRQINVYLDHGSPLKDMKTNGKPLTYQFGILVSQAAFFNPYLIDQYNVTEDRIVCTGIPRNDQLYVKHYSIKRIYTDISMFRKVIVWVPTFREHKDKRRIDCRSNFPLGIPLFKTEEEHVSFDNYLKKEKILIILKPHPAQDLLRIKSVNCSNFRILYNDSMLDADVQTNELLEQTDAMITDYSGIYYDYLLLDKPIAISLDDYEEYRSEKGFVFDAPLDILKGVHLYTTDQLMAFCNEVSQGIDSAKGARESIKRLTNDYCDGNSTERICMVVAEKYKQQFKEDLFKSNFNEEVI